MRLGGPTFQNERTPEAWIAAHRAAGYSAAFCPVDEKATDDMIRAYLAAARKADIVIAEVGAWSNPISPDEQKRRQAVELCTARLALADRVGARCCVNIAGARGNNWAGPHPDNLSPATFDLIVETVRRIVDAVRPTRTFYALETMPWVFPDSVESYVRLIKAIDRHQFAVHLDPVNLINCPARYFRNGDLIRECFAKLGPHIQSCHAKDIILQDKLTVHLDECRPGTGGLDYITFLTELNKLSPDIPLMLEHLPNAEEYALAAEHIRLVAGQIGVDFR